MYPEARGSGKPSIAGEYEHWREIAVRFAGGRSNRLWRRYCDDLSLQILDRVLADRTVRRLLKTDLFEEAAGEGLGASLRRRARHVVGIDLAPGIVRGARKSELLGAAADVRELPFPEQCFDLVISTSTLDHFETFEEIEASLRGLARVLSPGGRLLLTMDNGDNPIVALRNLLPFRLLYRIGLLPYFVGRTAGRRRLLAAVEGAGLTPDHVTTATLLHAPRVLAIPIARIIEKTGSPRLERMFLDVLKRAELLGRLPTRFLTGHFVVIAATRTSGSVYRNDETSLQSQPTNFQSAP